jgi:hypothetical protein
MTAWCGASAPGYRHALDDVGRDAQLPLERIAVSGSDNAKPESAAHVVTAVRLLSIDPT